MTQTAAALNTKEKTLPLDLIKHGTCEELLVDLPNSSVDLIVSSPPYNLGKEYEARQALDFYLAQQKDVLEQCARVLKPTGSIFWQVGAFSDNGILIPLDVRFFGILEALGLYPRNRIIWARQHGLHARRKFSCRHETILWFTKSDEYLFNLDEVRVPQKYQNKKSWKGENKGELTCNPDGKNPGDIWMFRNVKHNHEEQTIHPCQFPEDMVARIVLATTKPEGVVLDPYMGAGTVAVVAKDHGRHYLGAETDERYYDVIKRRLSGEPNKDGCFPNLKTLRDYVDRTGKPIEGFSFDVQVGGKATPRVAAKIYDEGFHLQEMEERLSFEESHFGARLKGQPLPSDRKLNGNGKPTKPPVKK